jgi:hypothetical protein
MCVPMCEAITLGLLMNTKGLGARLRKGPVAPWECNRGSAVPWEPMAAEIWERRRGLGGAMGASGGWQTRASATDGPKRGERG